jgi:hypothetical protein
MVGGWWSVALNQPPTTNNLPIFDVFYCMSYYFVNFQQKSSIINNTPSI